MAATSFKSVLKACADRAIPCTIHFRIPGSDPLRNATVEDVVPAEGTDAYVRVLMTALGSSISVHFNTADVYRIDVDWAKSE